MVPPDLTQEAHFEEAPFGTRGGKVFRYTFPVDAEYEIQLRLTRDRDEHVEGLPGNKSQSTSCSMATGSSCSL